MTTIKECFDRANEDVEAGDSGNENPADELVRFEFVDILMMLAELKLKRTGQVKSMSEAFAKLWHDMVVPWYNTATKTFKDFRSTHLYTHEVDKVFKDN